MIDRDHLLTPRDAATLLECPIALVRKALIKGDLPPRQRRGRIYYTTEDDAVDWYTKTYPHGVCVYGGGVIERGDPERCTNPQTGTDDGYHLHLCEEHTKQAHKILATPRPNAKRVFPTWIEGDQND